MHEGSLIPLKIEGGVTRVPVGCESKARTLNRLGLAPATTATFFVEDAIAKVALEEILAGTDFPISLQLQVIDARGASNVIEIAKRIPLQAGNVSFVGVLDGDMAETLASSGCGDKLALLPFPGPAETEFFALLEGGSARVVKALGRTHDQIGAAMEATTGMDLHDRFTSIAEWLQFEPERLARTLVPLWTNANKSRTNKFVRRLADLIKVLI